MSATISVEKCLPLYKYVTLLTVNGTDDSDAELIGGIQPDILISQRHVSADDQTSPTLHYTAAVLTGDVRKVGKMKKVENGGSRLTVCTVVGTGRKWRVPPYSIVCKVSSSLGQTSELGPTGNAKLENEFNFNSSSFCFCLRRLENDTERSRTSPSAGDWRGVG